MAERLIVTVLVHLTLAILAPSQAGHTLAISFSVSVVVLSANALSTRKDEPRDRADTHRRRGAATRRR